MAAQMKRCHFLARSLRLPVLAGIACIFASSAVSQVLPAAYWPLDADGSDVSGNTRHCSLLNGAGINTNQFIIGGAALGGQGAGGALDGAAPPGNDYAQANGGAGGVAWKGVTGSAARSISTWFKGPSVQVGSNPVLLSWGSTANGTRFELRFDRNGGSGGGTSFPVNSIRVEIAGNFICTTNGGYLDDQWHHVLATFPGGASPADCDAMKFYVDGKMVGHTPTNAAIGINTGTANNVFIGHGIMNGADRPFTGFLDDVALYGVELDPSGAALMYGLGRINGIGVDQLDEAQALWAGPYGGSAQIGGKIWKKTSGLVGGLGDWGGSWAFNDAYIVLDEAGNGIALGSTGTQFIWRGGPAGDGTSLFDEANWLDTASGTNPPAGSVDADADVAANLVITNGTLGGSIGAAGNLQLGGRSLTLSGGTLRFDTTGVNGVRDDADSGNDTTRSPVTITGGTLVAQFLGEIALTLAGDGVVALNGSGNPLNASIVNFLTNTCALVFSNKTPVQVVADYLGQLSVAGSPAVVGADPQLIEFGDNLIIVPQATGAVVQAAFGSDLDGDELPDAWEYQHFGNLSQGKEDDPDHDTLTNLAEFQKATNPDDDDTDSDGLKDNVETGTGIWVGLNNTGTDPLKPDTDSDGLLDGVENNTGIFVSASRTGTNPLNSNSDGDRFTDGAEVARGTDPNNPDSQPDLPNVIFILADDLGIGELGAYGQTKILTPNIDRLAREGMKFTQFYSPTAVCAPTRCQLLTGKHAGRAYIRNNGEVGNGYQRPLPPDTFTLGHLMRNAGYATSCIGKWGLGGENSTGLPWLQGFDHFFGYLGQVQAHHYYPSRLWRNAGKAYYSPTLAANEGGALEIPGAKNETGFDNLSLNLANKNNNGNVHSHDAMTREALNWIGAHTNQAFFLYLAYTVPHVSIQPPAHFDDLTDADGLVFNNTLRTCVDEFYPTNPATGLRPFGAPISHAGSGHYSATPDKRHEYAAMISAMDRDIGRIRSLLEASGLAENTLIFFTSDNGVTYLGEVDYTYFNSNAGLRGYKGNLYEGGIRAPFIAWGPSRIPAGTVSSVLGSLDDVMPTLAELTSTPHPPDVTGHSILPTLLGQPSSCESPREHVYFEFQEGSTWTRVVRKGDWKLRRAINTSGGTYTYALYNLASDPTESANLATANPALVAEMERQMDSEHGPAEYFFRPTDELPTVSGVTLSFGTLGLRLSGTGFGITPLAGDITDRVTFKLKLDNTGGATANGAFLFGDGTNAARFVKAEVDGVACAFRLTHGTDTATAAFPAAINAGDLFDFSVVWDPANALVTLNHGTNMLSLTLSSPPARVDHIGYSVNNSQTDFAPVTVCLDAPPLQSSGWCYENGQFRLFYQRPATQPGQYLAEESPDLEAWQPAAVLREQPRTGFGDLQDVTVEIRDRSRDLAAPPQLFYRIHYSE